MVQLWLCASLCFVYWTSEGSRFLVPKRRGVILFPPGAKLYFSTWRGFLFSLSFLLCSCLFCTFHVQLARKKNLRHHKAFLQLRLYVLQFRQYHQWDRHFICALIRIGYTFINILRGWTVFKYLKRVYLNTGIFIFWLVFTNKGMYISVVFKYWKLYFSTLVIGYNSESFSLQCCTINIKTKKKLNN